MEDAVVVGTFNDARAAEEAADALRNADITVDLGGSRGGGGDLLGSIELRVDSDQAERAREILGATASNGSDPNEQPDEEDPFADIDENEEQEWDEVTRGLHCPECESREVGVGSPYLYGYLTTAVVVFAAIFLLPKLASYFGVIFMIWIAIGIWASAKKKFPLHCKECGHAGDRGEFDPTRALEE